MQAVKVPHRQFIRGIGIVDETSCGPLCQHPACWKSVERQERGRPNIALQGQSHYAQDDDDIDLPVVRVYNMLDDYGESPQDRYPGGKAADDLTKPPREHRSRSKHKHKKNSLTLSDSFLKNVKPKEKAPVPVSVRNVEVQEVFDLEDLSNTWEQTFLSKQYYVWVPNPNYKPKSADNRLTSSEPQKITPRDMTEELVPRSIEEAREATTMRRNIHNRSKSPFRYYATSPRQPAIEDVDLDGINELLDLPREILMKVLDHCQPSDLRSKDRILDIVRRFMPDYEATTRHTSAKSQVLKQTKVRLHDGRMKNVRQPTAMADCKPVFQLDSWTEISANDNEEAAQLDSSRNRDFSKYKHVLPAIGEKAHSMDNFKLASVSLGLPELPSGVRTTRAFDYRNLDLDFTLGPSVPVTARSTGTSDGSVSEHGTAMNVNLPSHRSNDPNCPSDRREDPSGNLKSVPEPHLAISVNPANKMAPVERYVCPDPPLGTPISNGPQRPLTKNSMLRREATIDSVTENSSEKRAAPAADKKTPRVPPVRIPTESSAGKSPRTHSEGMKLASSRQGVYFHKEVPPQPPSSPQSGPGETSSLSPVPTVTPLAPMEHTKETMFSDSHGGHHNSHGLVRELQDLGTSERGSPVSSPDVWPTDVVENACSLTVSRTGTQASERLPMTPETLNSTAVGFDAKSEKSRLTSIPQSEAGSALSDPSVEKNKLTQKSSRESPGPPPPSPEPKDVPSNPAIRSGRFSSKSRDSLAMAPVFEEREESEDEASISAEPPQNLYNSQQFGAGFASAELPDSRELESPGGSRGSPRRVSAQVNIDMVGESNDPSTAANTDQDGLKTSTIQRDHQENFSNSNSADVLDVDRLAVSPPELADRYPICPPETDGQSSAYLTDRDRRFTPEGLDTTLDTDDNFPASNGKVESSRDEQEEEESVAFGGCALDEDDDAFMDESEAEIPFQGERAGSADGEVPHCEKDSGNEEQEEQRENELMASQIQGQSPMQTDRDILDSNNKKNQDEDFDAGAARSKVSNTSANDSAESSTPVPNDSGVDENGYSEEDRKSKVLEVPTGDSMEGARIEEDEDSGAAWSSKVDTETEESEDKFRENGIETTLPQSVSALLKEVETDDSGHVTPPQYTETSDRGSGGENVTVPTDELSSYIN